MVAEAAVVREELPWGAWRWLYRAVLVAIPILCCGIAAHIYLQIVLVAVTAVVLTPVTLYVSRYAWIRSRTQRLQWRYENSLAAWQTRMTEFRQAEWNRVASSQEWVPTPAPGGNRRIDVIGGDLWGWEAFLTVYGASTLAAGKSLTLVDVSGQQVSHELLTLAAARGYSVDSQVLPRDLADSDLLVGLAADQLVDVLVESIHGGSVGADRRERNSRAETGDSTVDHRILSTLCQQLGNDVTIARLVDAIGVLMGEPADATTLTAAEQAHIGDNLFSADYRRQAHGRLQQLDAYLHPLRALGTRNHPRPSTSLGCMTIDVKGPAVRHELLDDLIVQWLTHRIANTPDQPSTLLIAGADALSARHIESLSDVCSRRGVRLVLMFRHLRETALRVLGSGPVVFMRLGNHEEATRAADYIGRQHKFILSQLSRSLGGASTHSESISGDAATSPMIRLTRDWTTTATVAETLQWNQETSTARTYEYAVEPNVLQTLPDYGLLLVEPGQGGHVVRAVECNPGILTLPGAGPEPAPDGM
ncbi:hypothetical protein ACIA3K_24060 [Micromonospora sp. NPDC051543]|uniref:hypothetical protein n=1 Tax=Micromonospora sp. NPDC051543 TaxID=3364287 RepID=UPI00379BD1A3